MILFNKRILYTYKFGPRPPPPPHPPRIPFVPANQYFPQNTVSGSSHVFELDLH